LPVAKEDLFCQKMSAKHNFVRILPENFLPDNKNSQYFPQDFYSYFVKRNITLRKQLLKL
jgi:hypothetical protein